jgi:acetyltransferase-like isoleucine patch superfamily enzyme
VSQGSGPDSGSPPTEDPTAGSADEHGEGPGDAKADSGEQRAARHGRLLHHATAGPYNSIFHWTDARNPLRVMVNYIVIVICRITPIMRLKNWLLRRIGITVGDGVAWGLESTPDVFWPDLITVEDHAVIGYDATILCHEFLQDEYRTGEVTIGERAMLGAGVIVLPGVEIGAGAQVAANSLVADDVPADATVAGVPAERVDSGGDDESRD